jgi:hypothetical protein
MMTIGSGVTLQVNDGDEVLEPYRCQLYPDPLAPAERNAAARTNENKRLARFADLHALDRDRVAELISWKFQSTAHRRALAMRGISPKRWGGKDGAADLIRHWLEA